MAMAKQPVQTMAEVLREPKVITCLISRNRRMRAAQSGGLELTSSAHMH